MTRSIALSLCALAAGLSGCASYAGPFVSNISSDGRGGVVVEKCMAMYEPFMNTMSNANCTTYNIKLSKDESRDK